MTLIRNSPIILLPTLLALIALVACGTAAERDDDGAPASQPDPTPTTDTSQPTGTPTSRPVITGTPGAGASPTPAVPAEEADALLGQPFSLKPGDSALLAPGGLRVHLLEVEGGNAGVTVSVARDGEEIGQYQLKEGGPETADLGGHSLRLLSVQAARDASASPSVRLMAQAGQEVVDANTRFAFDLLAELREQEGDANIFMSPLSISMALAMTYNGAAGETERAMADALHLADMDRGTVNDSNAALLAAMGNRGPELELSVANSLWAREGQQFHQEFFDRVALHYGAEVESLPFNDAAKDRINGWVEDETEGKIEAILDEIKPNDVMYLINAIYFKGSWLYQFDEEDTEEGAFHNADGSQVQMPMMRQSWAKYDYLDGDGFSALRLPYKGGATMQIFLPDRESNLPEFLDGLNAQEWSEWMDAFQEDGSGEIVMPRFELEYDAALNDVLKAMGMEDAFSGDADFSDMGPGELFIDRVKHKAVVEVHEKGTEAAAATMVAMATSGPAFTFEFTVDRPFFFAITDDQTGSVLFTGAVRELGDK